MEPIRVSAEPDPEPLCVPGPEPEPEEDLVDAEQLCVSAPSASEPQVTTETQETQVTTETQETRVTTELSVLQNHFLTFSSWSFACANVKCTGHLSLRSGLHKVIFLSL